MKRAAKYASIGAVYFIAAAALIGVFYLILIAITLLVWAVSAAALWALGLS